MLSQPTSQFLAHLLGILAASAANAASARAVQPAPRPAKPPKPKLNWRRVRSKAGGRIVRTSEKAICFRLHDIQHDIWMPRSVCAIVNRQDHDFDVLIAPAWMFAHKGVPAKFDAA